MYDRRFEKQKVGYTSFMTGFTGFFATLFLGLFAVAIRLALIAGILYGGYLLFTDPGIIGRSAGTIVHEFNKQVTK